MKVTYYLLFAAFIAVAVFGFVGIIQNADFAVCAENVVNTNRCNNVNELAMGVVHADVFMSFVLTILSVIFIFLALFLEQSEKSSGESGISQRSYLSRRDFLYSFSKKIINWLGLLEKRTATHLS